MRRHPFNWTATAVLVALADLGAIGVSAIFREVPAGSREVVLAIASGLAGALSMKGIEAVQGALSKPNDQTPPSA